MGFMDLLKKNNDNNDKEKQAQKEYIKEVEAVDSFTDPKCATERQDAINEFVKSVVRKNYEK